MILEGFGMKKLSLLFLLSACASSPNIGNQFYVISADPKSPDDSYLIFHVKGQPAYSEKILNDGISAHRFNDWALVPLASLEALLNQ